MALLLAAGCSGEEKKEARPAGKKASVTAKPASTAKPAVKKVEAKPVDVKAKTGGGMCCCKGAGFISMVDTASCARDLGGSCVANSSCPK